MAVLNRQDCALGSLRDCLTEVAGLAVPQQARLPLDTVHCGERDQLHGRLRTPLSARMRAHGVQDSSGLGIAVMPRVLAPSRSHLGWRKEDAPGTMGNQVPGAFP